jgi:hypothetical protein
LLGDATAALRRPLVAALRAGKMVAVLGVKTSFTGRIYDLPSAGTYDHAKSRPLFLVFVGAPRKIFDTVERLKSEVLQRAPTGSWQFMQFSQTIVARPATIPEMFTQPEKGTRRDPKLLGPEFPSASGFLSWLRSIKQWREGEEADLQKLREDALYVSIRNLYESLTQRPPATGTLGIPDVPVWSMPVNAAGVHSCDAGRQTSRLSLLALAPDQIDALVKWLSIQHDLGSVETVGSILNTADRVKRDIEAGLHSVLTRGRDAQIEKAANDEFSATLRLRGEAERLRKFLESARKYITERLKEAEKASAQP